jgi:serine/threonine protein kinase
VAIKMVHPDQVADPQVAARFAREARLTAQINHPHVITVYSVHDDSDPPFIVMEYLHGGTLQSRLHDHPVSEEECIRIGREIAQGLQAAHEVGLLHRDLKPSNIGFRRPSGHVVIMDFGLARTLCDTESLTLHGSPVGTPAYMSPEQIQVQKLDHRTDLFSLGVVMYRMVSGQLPFQGGAPHVLCHSISSAPHTPLRRYVPGVSPGLESIINRLLQKGPAQRFQTAAQLMEALDRLSQQAPPPRRRWLIAGVTCALLFAAIGAYQAVHYFSPARESRTQTVAMPPNDTSGTPTVRDSPSYSAAGGPTDPTGKTPPVPEFRDASGVVWRSTNREHAGLVNVDADGVVRLEKPDELADNWAMVEGALVDRTTGRPTGRRYLLLDIVELAAGSDVSWAVKLAPPDDSQHDIELNYGRDAGPFAFRLPEPMGAAVRTVRIFIVGPDGAFVRFRDVRVADAIPDGFRELPVLARE